LPISRAKLRAGHVLPEQPLWLAVPIAVETGEPCGSIDLHVRGLQVKRRFFRPVAALITALMAGPAASQPNDPPTISVPGPITATEDVSQPIVGVTVSDPEGAVLDVNLTAANGTVTPSALNGTPAQINTQLATLTYQPDPDFSGAEAIDIFVADGPHFVADQVAVNVDPAPPQFSLPGPLVATEDAVLQITGVSLSDVDGPIDVNLFSPNATLNPDVYSGDAAAVNAALALIDLTPDPDYSGPLTVDIIVSDGPHFDIQQIIVNVDPAPPQISLPAPLVGSEDAVLQITGVALSDVDGPIDVNLFSPNATLDPNAYSGDAAAVNAALALIDLTPDPDYSGPLTVDIIVSDGPHFDIQQIIVNVDPAPPQITLPSSLELPTNTESLLPGIVVDPIDGDVTVSFQVDIGTVDPLQLAGDAASVTALIGSVAYTPPPGYVGPVSLTVAVADGPHFDLAETTVSITAAGPSVPALGPLGLGVAALSLALAGGVGLRRLS
jgi:hypothetical protein